MTFPTIGVVATVSVGVRVSVSVGVGFSGDVIVGRYERVFFVILIDLNLKLVETVSDKRPEPTPPFNVSWLY
jgi:hypothetical protein